MTLHVGIAAPIATADIVHLLDTQAAPPPRGYAGAPLLGTLIEELLRRGHHVSAFTLSSDLPLDDDSTVVLTGRNLTLYCCPMRPRAWPPNGSRVGRIVDLYAFERRGLERAIAQAKPDVVHAHWAYEFAWAALRSGLPHVVTCHDSPFVIARFQRDFRHGAYRWLRAGMAWHVLRHAQHVTTVSPYMVDQVQALCRVPVAVVPNPITALASAKKRRLRPGRMNVIMVCNGWGTLKNGAAALRAFALVSKRLPTAQLHVYGHDFGPGGAAERWWHKLGSSARIAFNGSVAHGDVLDAMAECDLLLHPSLEESFGAVLGEAMAMGLPVVAGERSGAVPWVVGKAGRLVDVSRPVQMADAMQALLTDAVASSELGRNGRTRVQICFSPEAVASQYLREYEAALAGSSIPR